MSRAPHLARGRWAERLAARSLQLRGYRVLARRYRTPVGEIDLVVRRGRLLAFVEVKARPDLGQALDARSAPAGADAARSRMVPAAPSGARRVRDALRSGHRAALAAAAPSGQRLACRLASRARARENAHTGGVEVAFLSR